MNVDCAAFVSTRFWACFIINRCWCCRFNNGLFNVSLLKRLGFWLFDNILVSRDTKINRFEIGYASFIVCGK